MSALRAADPNQDRGVLLVSSSARSSSARSSAGEELGQDKENKRSLQSLATPQP